MVHETVRPELPTPLRGASGTRGGTAAEPAGHPQGTAAGQPAHVGTLAAVLAAAEDSVERLARPLLELLHQVTGLESTYLTVIDWDGGTQRITYALNTGDLRIGEHLTVDWADTLCRRSLDEGRRCTTDVPSVWGDSEAARALGIVTYVSVPVLDRDEGVVGTLCAAGASSRDVDSAALATMDLFARLIATQLEREAAREAERARAEALERRTELLAEQDPLTGLLNPAGVDAWLSHALTGIRVGREHVAVARVDLDRFAAVTDTFGRATGDRLLQAVARSLTASARGGDLVGRLDADRFVVASVLPLGPATLGGWTSRLRRAAVGRVDGLEVATSLGVVCIAEPATAPAEVLARADAARRADKVTPRVTGTAQPS